MIFNSLKAKIILLVFPIVVFTVVAITLLVQHETTATISRSEEMHAKNLARMVLLSVDNEYKSLTFHRDRTINSRKQELKNMTELLLNYLNSLDSNQQEQAVRTIRNLRYASDRGYFWINDTQQPFPSMIMHPTMPDLEGTMLDSEEFSIDRQGNLFQSGVRIAISQGSGYLEYPWPGPDGQLPRRAKLSYVAHFARWDWVIGTGIYMDDIDAEYQQRLNAIISELQESLAKPQLPGGSYLLIFNGQGEVLAGPSTDLPATLEQLRHTPSGRAADYTDLNQDRRRAYVFHFKPLDWYIVHSFLIDQLYQPALLLRTKIARLAALFLIAALIAGLILAENLSRPLKKLAQAAQEVERNGFATIPITGTNETIRLGTTLDNMLGAINRTNTALRQNESRYEVVVKHSQQMIYDHDLLHDQINWNGAVLEVTGYRADKFAPSTSIFWQRVHPDDLATLQATLNEANRGRLKYRIQYRLQHSDRGYVHVDDNGTYMPNEDSPPLRRLGTIKDISDLKLRETELEESINRYRTLFENAYDAILIVKDGTITHCNAKLCELLKSDLDQIRNHKLRPLIRSDQQSEFDQAVINAGNGQPQQSEWWLTRPDGEAIFCQFSIVPIPQDASLQLVIRDITAQMLAESVRAGHLHFLENIDAIGRIMLQNINIDQMLYKVLQQIQSIFECDRVWLIFPCDPQSSHWRVPMEYNGQHSSPMILPDDDMPMVPEIAMAMQDVLDSNAAVCYHSSAERQLSAATLEYFDIKSQVALALRPKTGKPWMIGMHQCTYEREWTDDDQQLFTAIGARISDTLSVLNIFNDLMRSDARFRSLVANIPGAIFRCAADRDYTMHFISKVIRDITGYPAADFINNSKLTYRSIIVAEDRAQVWQSIQEAIQGDQSYSIEYRISDHQGTIRWIHERGQVVNDKPPYIDGAIFDITDKKNAEKVMIRSEKMLSVGNLAAGMAHEINNPLAGILQNVQVIQNRLSTNLRRNREVAKECGTDIETINAYTSKRNLLHMLAAIHEAGQRASHIVENILAFSRGNTAEHTPHSLAELIDRSLDLATNDYNLKNEYHFHKVKINREYDDSLPYVNCNASDIQQVILIIIKNSIEAMAKLKRRSPCLQFRLKRQGAMARIEIEDNGPGIEPGITASIMEPFCCTKGKGPGLGLSVAYFIIVEYHGGKMDVETKKGKWTRFIIQLPIETE